MRDVRPWDVWDPGMCGSFGCLTPGMCENLGLVGPWHACDAGIRRVTTHSTGTHTAIGCNPSETVDPTCKQLRSSSNQTWTGGRTPERCRRMCSGSICAR